MSWYEFAAPVLVIAVLVRLEAVFAGPYWSWIEMFPLDQDEDEASRRVRRRSMWRRVAIPGGIAFALAYLWPARYDEVSLAVVGSGAAGLLLWPVAIHGLPLGVRRSDWQIPFIYVGLIVAFASSAWLGGHLAQWVIGRDAGIVEIVRENVFGLLVGAVIVGGATTVLDVAATLASRARQGRLDEQR